MDGRNDIREFLISRRARLTPEQAGLPNFGGARRVPGLRREEVALLAGMSVEYYVRLERGNASGVSESVLQGISRALQLDDAEREHLVTLARVANDGARPTTRRRAPRADSVRPAVQQTLDAMTDVAAYVQNGRLDLVATNLLGAALLTEMYVQPHRPPNFGRFMFLEEERSRALLPDWDAAAQQTVALLRTDAGRNPYDRALTDLVGELSTRSDVFRTLWASHDVREHQRGSKRFRHPVVGDLELTYEGLELASERGLLLIAYTAEPGSPSRDALHLLATWATSHAPVS